MDTTERYAYFALRGFDMPPGEISSLLGVEASKAWMAGALNDVHRVPGKKREESFWRMDSRIARDADVFFEEHLKDLLLQLAPSFDAAASLSKRYRGIMVLVGYFCESNPYIGFSVSTIELLRSLGVEVDLDLYYVGRKTA